MALLKSCYFHHDYNASNDAKVLFLRQQLGMEGYGIYWFILEQLAQAGGSLPLKIIPVLAMQSQTQETKVRAVIDGYELFNVSADKFFSMRLNGHLEIRKLLSDKGKEGAVNRWGSESDGYNRKKALRAAQKIESHTPQEWNEMLLFFDYKCVKCGSDDGVLKDHIIPLRFNGLDGINNIQPLCKSCNSGKGNERVDYRLGRINAPNIWFKNGVASGAATANKEINKEIKKGVFFSSDNLFVVFSDGEQQALGEVQLNESKNGSLLPKQVFKGNSY